jgi:hypothetical protein
MSSSPPASPAALKLTGAQILTLMGNYWTRDESREARALLVDSWLEDLEEFGPEPVAGACREWRRHQTHRPRIADIRKLCIELQENAKFRALPKPELMPEAEQIEIADIWARNQGFASMAEVQRSPDFTGASIKIGPRLWRRFEAIRPPVAVAPADFVVPYDKVPEPPAKRPTPQHILDRDAARAEDRRKALALDQVDKAVDRYIASLPGPPADEVAA